MVPEEGSVHAGGPQAALQNMVMLGLFSYVVDSMQMQTAEASTRQSSMVLLLPAATCHASYHRYWESCICYSPRYFRSCPILYGHLHDVLISPGSKLPVLGGLESEPFAPSLMYAHICNICGEKH